MSQLIRTWLDSELSSSAATRIQDQGGTLDGCRGVTPVDHPRPGLMTRPALPVWRLRITLEQAICLEREAAADPGGISGCISRGISRAHTGAGAVLDGC